MARLLTLAIVLLAALPAGASNAVSLGYSDRTTIVGPGTDACASGVLIHDHDGSFEDAYSWQYGGVLSPYYGAIGEAYDLGAGTIACGAYWLTGLYGYEPPMAADLYVWEGGVGSAPGAVVSMLPSVQFEGIPQWPTIGECDVDLGIPVAGPFTLGYWPIWPGAIADFFCAADLDGPPGHPWTCIAPGIGYPSGWQDPSIVWGPTSAMGCGAYFEGDPTPAQSPTWGAIRAMFRR